MGANTSSSHSLRRAELPLHEIGACAVRWVRCVPQHQPLSHRHLALVTSWCTELQVTAWAANPANPAAGAAAVLCSAWFGVLEALQDVPLRALASPIPAVTRSCSSAKLPA